MITFSEYLENMPDDHKASLLQKARRFSTNLASNQIEDVIQAAVMQVLPGFSREDAKPPKDWLLLISYWIPKVTAEVYRKEYKQEVFEEVDRQLALVPDATNSRNAFLSALSNTLPVESRLLLPNQALGPHHKFQSRTVAIEVVDANLKTLRIKLYGLEEDQESFRIKQVLSAKIQSIDEVATGFVEQQDLDNKKNEGSAQIRFNPAKSKLLNSVEANSYLCCRVETRTYRRKQLQAVDEIPPPEQEPDSRQIDPFKLAFNRWFDIIAVRAKLTVDEKTVMFMKCYEGMKHEDIATTKGMTVNQVNYLIYDTIRNKIRACFPNEAAFPDVLSD